MNAIEAIKRKAKSAYHSGGLRNRKTAEMKRKSNNSEPDAIGRPRKSPRSSEASLASEKGVIGSGRGTQAKRTLAQDAKAVHGSTVNLRRSERLRNQAKHGNQSINGGDQAGLKRVDQVEEAKTSDMVARRVSTKPAPGSSSARSPNSDVGPGVGKVASTRPISQETGSHRVSNPSSPDWEQQQAIREDIYITFSGEDADDYTYGPVRIVHCSDGVSRCASMLLTLEFSKKVQTAVRSQRDFSKLEKRATKEEAAAMRFEGRLKSEIESHKYRLRELEQGQPESEKFASLSHELEVLEQMLEESRSDRKCTKALVESRASILREIQSEVNAYLEEAFVYARLLEPEGYKADVPIEERDLQEEYAKFCRNLQESADEQPASPLDVSRDYLRAPPPNAEQQARQELVDAWYSARDRLQLAEETFDQRQSARDRDREAFMEAVELGYRSRDNIADEFDLPWLKRFQAMTRELIDAERAFSVAQANASEAGIEIQRKHTWTSPSNSEQGTPVQQDQAQEVPAFAASNPRITRWLDFVPSSGSSTHEEDLNEDDISEDLDVKPLDSLSAAAESTVRRRIDQWSKICSDESCGDKFCQSELYHDPTEEPSTPVSSNPRETLQELAAAEDGYWGKLRGVRELLDVLKEPRHL